MAWARLWLLSHSTKLSTSLDLHIHLGNFCQAEQRRISFYAGAIRVGGAGEQLVRRCSEATYGDNIVLVLASQRPA